MKIKALISKLEKLYPNLDVFINYDGQGPSAHYSLKKESAEDNEWPEDWKMPKEWVEIYLRN